MPDSDTVSNASTATARSRRGLLRWRDIEEGMVGRANHSIKHAVVPALMSVMPTVEPDSLLQRHYNELSKNKGKYRPFIVVEKPHGPNRPGRIVLTTHFDRRPISEVDAGAQALAVALGTRTPPWPAEDSPRIRTEPEWLEENSYAIAYAIALQYDRQATRFRAAGKEYQVVGGELKTLRKVCAERAVSLANMSREQLEALKASYERIAATLPSAASSWRGSFYSVQSHISVLPPIAENTLPETQETINEIDQEGFTQVKRVRRRARRGKNREESEGPAV